MSRGPAARKLVAAVAIALGVGGAPAPARAWWSIPVWAVARVETPRWMSWYGGVDLFGTTGGAIEPNVMLHVSEVVHTPVGSAATCMIVWRPDPTKPPEMFGFLSNDDKLVGPWLGPNIFAGTPFEHAPTGRAKIAVKRGEDSVTATIEAGPRRFELTLAGFGPATYVNRRPTAGTPFYQNAVERTVARVALKVDGKDVAVQAAVLNPAGGPGAVWTELGSYAR